MFLLDDGTLATSAQDLRLASECEFALLHRVMQEGVNVGVAYGLWASGGVISTALLSAALFGEPLGVVKLAGIALIMAGVFCVEMGAKPDEDEDRRVEVAPQ